MKPWTRYAAAILTSTIFTATLALWGCAPLIQTGGSVNVVQRPKTHTPPTDLEPIAPLREDAPVTVITHGGQSVAARSGARVDADARSSETPSNSTWRNVILFTVLPLIIGIFAWLIITHWKTITALIAKIA